MLERYFSPPSDYDRIRASWLRPAIEQCATWLIARGHAAKNLARYVPIQMHFAAFAQARGATRYEISRRMSIHSSATGSPGQITGALLGRRDHA